MRAAVEAAAADLRSAVDKLVEVVTEEFADHDFAMADRDAVVSDLSVQLARARSRIAALEGNDPPP